MVILFSGTAKRQIAVISFKLLTELITFVFFDTQQVNRVLVTPLVSSVSNTGCLLQSDPLMFVTSTLREEAAKT